MKAEDLCFLTLAGAARLIRRRALSSVELTRALLKRAETLNPRLNAYITITPEEALRQAQQADRLLGRGEYRSPLHGVPVALKDLFATRGVRTTGGSKLLATWVPKEDCTVVSRLKAAGGVILGKLNMHELAYGVTTNNPHYGPARNPWALDYTPGGSSGGSGVATAAHLCIASLGSDSGGSIRIPAAMCGVVGLKPTYGRVSRHGVLALSWSLDHMGPMTKTVEDAALVLETIAGFDPKDPGSLDAPVPRYSRGLKRGIKGLRVGVLANDYFASMDGEVEAAFTQALGVLEDLGAAGVRVRVPLAEHAALVNTVILMAEAAANHQKAMASQREAFGKEVWDRLALGLAIPAMRYIQAQRLRRLIREKLATTMQRVDVLALPALPLPAQPIEASTAEVAGRRVDVRSAYTRYMQLFNLTGYPALSVPCGFTAKGLPIGIQLAGRPLDEGTLLRVAYAYEQATPWHRRRPPLEG